MIFCTNSKTNLLSTDQEMLNEYIKNFIFLETENLSSATSIEFLLDNSKRKELS